MATRQVAKKTRQVAKKTRQAAKNTRKVVKRAPKTAKKKSAKRSKSKAPWTAAQSRDYKAIEKRAMTLAKSLTDADFDAKGNPINPAWSRLLRDLDTWAAKYSVKLSTQQHNHAGGGGTGPVPRAAGGCPGSFQTEPRYHSRLPNGMVLMAQTSCTLKRRTLLGRCVYSCTEEMYSV